MELIASTSSEYADRVIIEIIDYINKTFVGLFSVYVHGSYACSIFDSNSDLDLMFVFDKPNSFYQQKQFIKQKFNFDLKVDYSAISLQTCNNLSFGYSMKQYGLLVFGNKIDDYVEDCTIDSSVFFNSLFAYRSINRLRTFNSYLKFPLDYPNCSSFCFGYINIRKIINIVTRICKVLSVVHDRVVACTLTRDKWEFLQTCKKYNHLNQFHDLFNNLIKTKQLGLQLNDLDFVDRDKLYFDILEFENYFMQKIQFILSDNLNNSNKDIVYKSIDVLGNIDYKNDLSVSGLQNALIENNDNKEFALFIQNSLDRLDSYSHND